MSFGSDDVRDYMGLIKSLTKCRSFTTELVSELAREMNMRTADVVKIMSSACNFWEQEPVEIDPKQFNFVRAYEKDENDSLLHGTFDFGGAPLLVCALAVAQDKEGRRQGAKSQSEDSDGRDNVDKLWALRHLVNGDALNDETVFNTVRLTGYKHRYVIWMEPGVKAL